MPAESVTDTTILNHGGMAGPLVVVDPLHNVDTELVDVHDSLALNGGIFAPCASSSFDF